MKETQTTGPMISAWHAPSLRSRVALLAGTVVILLVGTLLILLWVLRTTQANAVARSQKHLSAVAKSLKTAYESRPNPTATITRVEVGPPPPPKPERSPAGNSTEIAPPPPPEQKPKPPGGRSQSPEEQSLEQITAKVLQDETGIEGGFFRPGDQRLLGYAFPTHEGPGDPKALPARETPDIVNIASAAFTAESLQQNEFYGPHDVVLFIAVPVCDTASCAGAPVGSAWLMQRIPGAESDRKRALLWSAFGFGAIACVTVLFAFFVLRQVGQGTEAILNRLTWMESDLNQQQHPPTVRLAEFHRVLDGLDRLGVALRGQIDRERELQERVRQNERLAAIGQLAAGVAHELRNPLATIRLRAQMTQRKTQEELSSQGSTVILAEVDRLDAMIERLLDLSRPIRLSTVKTEISTIAESAVVRWRARRADINLRFIGQNDVEATVDPLRLEQVFDNLIENAIHQLDEQKTDRPWIKVDCQEQSGEVTLTVSDNAGGFSLAALKSAVEPFFTTRAKGTGLGLAITQEIVHAMHGTLSIANEGDGAVVRILFPAEPR
ncbi:sensor histidine kinase [Silvibacterium acidisoli]|uniref:sensor histidine kinase n=1 Tax=Acidobacteriaceae bacterium ZG23-2 TaxID=2883246 RepID=UPI00406CFBFB